MDVVLDTGTLVREKLGTLRFIPLSLYKHLWPELRFCPLMSTCLQYGVHGPQAVHNILGKNKVVYLEWEWGVANGKY